MSVERRERAIAAHGAFAPARFRRLESDRAAPVPAAAATLPSTLLDGSHHPREVESCCTRVVCGGSDCSSDGGTDGGGDGGGDGLWRDAGNESIHWSKLDTQRSKSACLGARTVTAHAYMRCVLGGIEAPHGTRSDTEVGHVRIAHTCTCIAQSQTFPYFALAHVLARKAYTRPCSGPFFLSGRQSAGRAAAERGAFDHRLDPLIHASRGQTPVKRPGELNPLCADSRRNRGGGRQPLAPRVRRRRAVGVPRRRWDGVDVLEASCLQLPLYLAL
eukprot:scaffold14192_cov80-Phaeocystis_antarctica.AAC.2